MRANRAFRSYRSVSASSSVLGRLLVYESKDEPFLRAVKAEHSRYWFGPWLVRVSGEVVVTIKLIIVAVDDPPFLGLCILSLDC